MAKCRMRLDGHDAGEPKAAHDLWMWNEVPRWSFYCAPTAIEPESARSYSYDDTGKSDARYAVLDREFRSIELVKISSKHREKKVLELLHCTNFAIEAVSYRSKSVTSCSEPVRAGFSRQLEKQGLMEADVGTKE